MTPDNNTPLQRPAPAESLEHKPNGPPVPRPGQDGESEAPAESRAQKGPGAPVEALPVLPLKNTVLFPGLFIPLSVGRPQSLAAIEAALATEEKTFVVSAQRDASIE